MYKDGEPSKILNVQKPIMPVLEGSKREEDPHRHPTLRRSALESFKKNDASHPSDAYTGPNKTFMLHGPGTSSEE